MLIHLETACNSIPYSHFKYVQSDVLNLNICMLCKILYYLHSYYLKKWGFFWISNILRVWESVRI